MKVWGLTGNIACGKSAVEDILRHAGVPVLDADQAARRIVEPGEPALEEIARTFGPNLLMPDGQLDRKALGSLVFSDPTARATLERITHPRIAQHLAGELTKLAEQDEPLAVVSAALMFESGSFRNYDGVAVVTCPPDIQLERLRARDELSDQDAQARINSQMPQQDKARQADRTLDNSGLLVDLESQVLDWISSLDTSS